MVALTLLGCAPVEVACPCADVPLVPVATIDDVQAAIDASVPVLYPDLVGVSVTAAVVEDVRYFQANVDLTTAMDPPRERHYRVEVDPLIFDDPPSADAFRAVIAHELGHVEDYVGMDTNALVEFALWYAGGDVGDYEHATDEKALARGCGAGLAAYRTWLYDHVDGEILAEKQANYYTPDDIAAWQAANTCTP